MVPLAAVAAAVATAAARWLLHQEAVEQWVAAEVVPWEASVAAAVAAAWCSLHLEAAA